MQVGSSVVAVFDFVAEGEGELSFSTGELMTLVQVESADNPGWLYVQKVNGTMGYVPSDFIKEVEPSQNRMSIAVPPALKLQFQQLDQEQQQPHYGAPAQDPWSRRDKLYGEARFPPVSERRWFYRDIFGDLQGPFNADEMHHRVEAKHIQPDTFCVLEVGQPSQHEERRLRELFPTTASPFSTSAELAPQGGSKNKFWYFSIRPQQEFGPFSTDQMRFWFDVEGYFGSNSLVRDASFIQSKFVPLSQLFPDPMMCFVGEDAALPPQAQQQRPSPPPAAQMEILDPFQSARRSSRSLMKQALSGDNMDDTLALFDQIEMETKTTTTSNPAAAAPSPPPKIRVYGSFAWPLWRGVPSQSNEKGFPTVLYSFVTRPLNPGAGKIFCHVTREIDGLAHLNYNKFRVFLENEDGAKLTLMATRHTGIVESSYFDIKLCGSEKSTPLSIAKLEVNFMGTQFTLHNDVSGHVGPAKDLCCILYESNRMSSGGGPRKMKVAIPDVDEKGEFKVYRRTPGSNHLLSELQQINASKCIPMLNKPPKWNPARQAYSLDFGGRVQRASVKNFQLVDALHDPEYENVILQHGRVSEDKFTMDVQHPMSLVQAFAVCLSSLHSKKGVD